MVRRLIEFPTHEGCPGACRGTLRLWRPGIRAEATQPAPLGTRRTRPCDTALRERQREPDGSVQGRFHPLECSSVPPAPRRCLYPSAGNALVDGPEQASTDASPRDLVALPLSAQGNRQRTLRPRWLRQRPYDDSSTGSWNRSKLVAGDFDGDGRTDIGVRYDYGQSTDGGNRTGLWKFTSNGSGFNDPAMTSDSKNSGSWNWHRSDLA
ncbi:FG-GAP repeat protein [Kitasatospora sp. GP82]|uniref:FG-GAP repeat protein n=1 Tax=Kitasatospora sp. GP82 TaxID=3035089 RepID=UPI002475199A|nr:FG-GAP repeat protein [Kitasatospora sp. GP82]MDH6124935.1 hypothetical protein [Kitasatospora sp. GP82]